MLLTAQYTCFSLSILKTRVCKEDVVLNKPLDASITCVDWLVMSMDNLYHEILAGGLQNDVVQVRWILSPTITVIEFGVNITDVTGTVKFNY